VARIFVSYRRADSQAITGRLYDRLLAAFGRRNVFKDVNVILPGSAFGEVIAQELDRCGVMLVVIGTQWLTLTDDRGRRRLDDPDDWVRTEVRAGLRRPKMRVIPVLVDNANMPARTSLPPDLQPLCDRQAAQVRHDPDFDRDVSLLIRQIRGRVLWPWVLAVAVLLAALTVIGVLRSGLLNSAPDSDPTSLTPVSDPTQVSSGTGTQPSGPTPTEQREVNVTGRLLWNDQPAAGLEVKFTGMPGTPGFYLTTTDEQGVYALSLPPGEYAMFYRFPDSVNWVAEQSTPYFSPYRYVERPIVVEEGTTTTVNDIHTIKETDLKILAPNTAVIRTEYPQIEWAAYPFADHYSVWVYESHTTGDGVPYSYPAGSPLATRETSVELDWPLSELVSYYVWVIAYNANEHELADGRSYSFEYSPG